MFDFIPASAYSSVFYNLILVLCIFKCVQINSQNRILYFLICIFLVLFIGLRPISGYFGDTSNYAALYAKMQESGSFEWSKEWVFNGLMFWFANSGFSVHIFFLFVESIYIGCTAWACSRLFKNNGYLAFLMVVSAFSFYTYSMNGIRNGMAVAIVMLAISFLNTSKVVAAVFAFIAVNIHNSMILPVLSAICCLFYNNTKFYFIIWGCSIVLSATVGGTMEAFFASSGLVDDNRFAAYLTNKDNMHLFSNTGFRWDFLLYSCVPILLGYYFFIKKGFRDKIYLFYINTYILSNSFWILVIRASYSNRFAYLSWFLYGIVLLYPLLYCNDLNQRSTKIRWALLGNMGFSYFMWIAY